MTDKIYILANEEVADKCMLEAIDWHAGQSKFKESPDIKGFAVAVVGEYLANQKGFTMYTDKAKYPKEGE
jgi:hypothetical protein